MTEYKKRWRRAGWWRHSRHRRRGLPAVIGEHPDPGPGRPGRGSGQDRRP